MTTDSVLIRWLGLQDYEQCWHAMRDFTNQRDENTQDEIWAVEHPPVFTQGQSGKPEHILSAGNIPIIQVDRGGQVTYHGPGQLVIYPLVDLKRKKLNVRETVTILEKSVIELLREYNINAVSQCKAPGVYIDDKKICSLGLRIRRGCSFHGLALNVDMDLEPFSRINPCGYPELKMTQLSDFIRPVDIKHVGQKLIGHLIRNLGYTTPII
jgi:lipoyl(octanoyl) transferase